MVDATARHIGVRSSRELDRILALPRRDMPTDVYPEIRRILTRPGSDRQLWDDQCASLVEALDAGGLFGVLSVGSGKTLISHLLPTVLQRSAVILTTPGLMAQGTRDLAESRKNFRVRPDVKYVAYSRLSHRKHASTLERLRPGLIIADESHKLSARNTAVFKRFARYLIEHPDTIVCLLSGSIVGRSCMEFFHLLATALGEWSPCPRDYSTQKEWSEALDPVQYPRPTGMLRLLCEGLETPNEGFQRRMADTRGVVISAAPPLDLPLDVVTHDAPEAPGLDAIVAEIEERWERPDGEQFKLALEVAECVRQVRLGGFYRWIWPDGVVDVEWMDARSKYFSSVRAALKGRCPEGYDSPKLIEEALERGEWTEDDVPGWTSWLALRDRYKPKPPTEWVWVTTDPIDSIAGMVEGPTIVWTDITAVGRRMADVLECPYYGGGKESAKAILSERGDRTVVASIQAHGTGRNLQCYSRALVAGGSTGAKMWEQLLGRLHRPGQTAPRVRYDVIFRSEVQGALEFAKFVESTSGAAQRLLLANISHAS